MSRMLRMLRPRRGRQSGYWVQARYNWAAEVTADNKYLWLTSNGMSRIQKVNLDTRLTEVDYPLSANGSAAMGFVISGNTAWVAHEENTLAPAKSLVSKIDLGTGAVTDIAVTPAQRCRGIAQDATYVYVGMASVSTEFCSVLRINKTDNTTTVLSLGVSADIWFALAVVGTSLYVGLNTGQVVKVNLTTFAVAATILANVSNDLRHVVKHPGSGKLYFTAFGADKVRGFDTSTDAWSENWATGSWPIGLALTPSGDHLYVHEIYANQIRVIKTSDGTAVESARALHPTALQSGSGVPAIQPDNKFVYFHSTVGDKNSGTGYVNAVAVAVS